MQIALAAIINRKICLVVYQLIHLRAILIDVSSGVFPMVQACTDINDGNQVG